MFNVMSHSSFSLRAGKFSNHFKDRLRELEGLQLASFRDRAIAFVIDFLFSFALFSVITIYGSKLMIVLGLLKLEGDVKYRFNFENVYSLVFIVLYFGLVTYFTNGKTLGKKIMKIRVLSLSHHQISLWHAIERSLGYAASALEFGFGFIQYFIHPNRCTVHDRIAETIVVKDQPGKR